MWILECEWIEKHGGTGKSVDGYAKYKKDIVKHMKGKGYKYSTQYQCWVEYSDHDTVKYWYTPRKLEYIGER